MRGHVTLFNKLNYAAEFTWSPIVGEKGTAFSIRPANGGTKILSKYLYIHRELYKEEMKILINNLRLAICSGFSDLSYNTIQYNCLF